MKRILVAIVACLFAVGVTPAEARPTSTIPNDPYSTASKAFPYTSAVPGFPARVPDYAKSGKVKRSQIRLFAGNGWQPLPEFSPGLAGHCDVAVGMVRWRSSRPDAVVQASVGASYPGEYLRQTKVSRGGAGYFTFNVCLSPALKIVAGEGGYDLLDVDYEYQIWEQRRPI